MNGPPTGRDGNVSARPATPHRETAANGEKGEKMNHHLELQHVTALYDQLSRCDPAYVPRQSVPIQCRVLALTHGTPDLTPRTRLPLLRVQRPVEILVKFARVDLGAPDVYVVEGPPHVVMGVAFQRLPPAHTRAVGACVAGQV